METFDISRCAAIAERIRQATEKYGPKVLVTPYNYEASAGILCVKSDGSRSAWTVGLINRPNPDEQNDDWQPIVANADDAISAAIAFIQAA